MLLVLYQHGNVAAVTLVKNMGPVEKQAAKE
jgi:hypothetical protein